MDNKSGKTVVKVILSVMTFVGVLIGAGGYYLWDQVRAALGAGHVDSLATQITETVAWLENAGFTYWIVPLIVLVFVMCGGLLSQLVNARLLGDREARVDGDASKNTVAKKDFLDHKIEQERKRRLFLHTLSILQREGRLLDFFEEDLSLYEDGQIGAAVRSIQEDCKKAVKKYIDPQPVLDGNEGDSVTIDEGFDIDAINLVGNVSGKPPFDGVIRHPGWKAGKKDVPKLSDIQDSSVMTPAEVEIR